MFNLKFTSWGLIALSLALIGLGAWHYITKTRLEATISEKNGEIGKLTGAIHEANSETTKANTAIDKLNGEISLLNGALSRHQIVKTNLETQSIHYRQLWESCVKQKDFLTKFCSGNRDEHLPEDYTKGVSDADYKRVMQELNMLINDYNTELVRLKGADSGNCAGQGNP